MSPNVSARPGKGTSMHKNARLAPKGREVLVHRLCSGQRPAEVARSMGMSETTVRKWWRPHRRGEGLEDRCSRPRRSLRALSITRQRRIEALRRQRRTGRWIAAHLNVSRATVSRVLRRAGISRWRELQPEAPARRYVWAHPGELIHLDTKKLGRIGSPGHRVTGRREHRHRGIDWEYVHVAIDDHSRTTLATVAEDERQGGVVAFLGRVVEHYQQRGIRVQRVMTDNGSPYVSHAFRDACAQLGLRHLRTRPTRRAPTARPSASSRRPCESGPTRLPTVAHGSAATPSAPGCTTTTGIGPTAPWRACRRSPDSASAKTTY